MTPRNLFLVGVLAFVASAIAFAPVTLLRPAFAAIPGLAVTELGGSLWRGSAMLAYRGTVLGQLTFAFSPSELLLARFGYDVALAGPAVTLAGRVSAAPGGYRARLGGNVGLVLAAPELARYDLDIPGELGIDTLALDGRWGTPLPTAQGELNWSGGTVRYVLGGRANVAELPPLSGFIDSSSGYPQMTVYARNDATPLLLAHVKQDGMASVGITKQFTKRVGQTWVGGEPDHAVVLEVAEKLF
jgi:hypothetical protein